MESSELLLRRAARPALILLRERHDFNIQIQYLRLQALARSPALGNVLIAAGNQTRGLGEG